MEKALTMQETFDQYDNLSEEDRKLYGEYLESNYDISHEVPEEEFIKIHNEVMENYKTEPQQDKIGYKYNG